MKNLKITLVQADLKWEDTDTNLKMFDGLFDCIKNDTDLIVLPEMFSTGFSMKPERFAQTMDGETVNWMKRKSRDMECDLTGSVMIREGDVFYNRLIWVKPDGLIYTYNKKHLFRHAGEQKVYTQGDQKLSVELKGWKIRPFICYDLRFPLWIRNFNKEYDLAIFVANWPEKRSSHWNALLLARAIENQIYVAAVNRVGKDGNGNFYRGDSSVIDPSGEVVLQVDHTPGIFHAELKYSELISCREQFPVWRDADVTL